MTLLESVHGPADLKRMDQGELTRLADELRDFLVDKVCTNGGHLGPNLGVVELTLAIHRVFDSPRDAVLFDVGHQSYVHKAVTGRSAEFAGLRQQGGIAGYPARAESEHDLVENSHASTALSYADGLAKAFQLAGEDRHAVAVVGDGALTGGMCWEALNNIAADPHRPIVIVVNDNGRSYSPTIGGLAEHLAALRLQPGYERLLDGGRELLQSTPVVGRPLYAALHAAKAGLKDALSPQRMFSDLGLKYLGPVDGHDLTALEKALHNARAFGGPVIVHAVTEKGHGYPPAVNHEADQMHQTDPIDRSTGKPPAKGTSWTSVFGSELARIGEERQDVVAITAAMLRSTGLHTFAEAHPDRWFDVGIAEQHAMTSAAGLAMGGMHPVVAVYSTFLNRAFDQLLMDVALHRQPVTVVLDRAGITGPDGPSHHGMWTCPCSAWSPASGWRHRGTRRPCARSCARRWPSTTGPACCGSPRAGSWSRCPRSAGSARWTCCVPRSRAGRTCCWSRSARSPGSASPPPTGSPTRASGSPWWIPGGCSRCRGSWWNWPGSTGWWSPWRTAGGTVASAPRWRPRCGTPNTTSRCAISPSRRSSIRTDPGTRCSPRSG